MRLVLATPLYPPEAGGPATFAKVMEDELPKRGWEVVTVRFRDVRQYPKVIRHLVYWYRVWRAAKSGDRVLALDPVSTGLPALLAAWCARRPFYVRVAGDYAWEQGVQRWGVHDMLDTFAPSARYPLPVRVLKHVESFVARHAVRVIVPSAYLARIISLWGVDAGQIRVAYNAGPVVGEVAPAPLKEPYVISVARLVPWKGMDSLVRAFAQIAKPARLVIVGDGPERAHIEAAASDAGVTERVTLTGNLSHEETLAYLAHAESFVLNTRYEGLSHLILEAFALGVPVLTTSAGGNAEVVHEGETGLIFPYGDEAMMAKKITEAHNSPGLRASLAEGGRAIVATFTTEQMVDSVVAALTETHP